MCLLILFDSAVCNVAKFIDIYSERLDASLAKLQKPFSGFVLEIDNYYYSILRCRHLCYYFYILDVLIWSCYDVWLSLHWCQTYFLLSENLKDFLLFANSIKNRCKGTLKSLQKQSVFNFSWILSAEIVSWYHIYMANMILSISISFITSSPSLCPLWGQWYPRMSVT